MDRLKFANSLIIDDVGLLGCNAVWTRMYIPTFWRNILVPSSDLKMGLVFTYESRRRHNPEEQHHHPHRCEILNAPSFPWCCLCLREKPPVESRNSLLFGQQIWYSISYRLRSF
jgi:hypothetical protein